MPERRNSTARFGDEIEIDVGEGNIFLFPTIGEDTAPGIDNERVAEAFSTARQRSKLAGGDDEAAVLNGAGTVQNVPVCFARHSGEGRRNGKHLGARLRIAAIKFREPQIVAHRQSNEAAGAGRKHRLSTWSDGGAFAIGLAIAQIDVEQVQLVVSRSDVARWDQA